MKLVSHNIGVYGVGNRFLVVADRGYRVMMSTTADLKTITSAKRMLVKFNDEFRKYCAKKIIIEMPVKTVDGHDMVSFIANRGAAVTRLYSKIVSDSGAGGAVHYYRAKRLDGTQTILDYESYEDILKGDYKKFGNVYYYRFIDADRVDGLHDLIVLKPFIYNEHIHTAGEKINPDPLKTLNICSNYKCFHIVKANGKHNLLSLYGKYILNDDYEDLSYYGNSNDGTIPLKTESGKWRFTLGDFHHITGVSGKEYEKLSPIRYYNLVIADDGERTHILRTNDERDVEGFSFDKVVDTSYKYGCPIECENSITGEKKYFLPKTMIFYDSIKELERDYESR